LNSTKFNLKILVVIDDRKTYNYSKSHSYDTMSMLKNVDNIIVAPIVCFSLFLWQKLASSSESGGRRN
jgi:hypothetical protein